MLFQQNTKIICYWKFLRLPNTPLTSSTWNSCVADSDVNVLKEQIRGIGLEKMVSYNSTVGLYYKTKRLLSPEY